MSEGLDLEQLERQAREEAIRSIKVRNLPQIGPTPIGRWTNIGIGRKTVMDALGLSGEEAAAILGEHLGKTIPFRFASWSVAASIKISGFTAQPMISFRSEYGAPDFGPSVFWGLFFWGNEIDHLQWSTGTFGGMTGGRWRTMFSEHALTLHEFTVHGTVIDELAMVRSFGIPHDEKALAINPPTSSSRPDAKTSVLATSEPRRRGRPAGSGTYDMHDAPLLDEMASLLTSGAALSPNAAALAVADRAFGGGSQDSKVKRLRDAYLHRERNGA